jgi:hypothetical protein
MKLFVSGVLNGRIREDSHDCGHVPSPTPCQHHVYIEKNNSVSAHIDTMRKIEMDGEKENGRMREEEREGEKEKGRKRGREGKGEREGEKEKERM